MRKVVATATSAKEQDAEWAERKQPEDITGRREGG